MSWVDDLLKRFRKPPPQARRGPTLNSVSASRGLTPEGLAAILRQAEGGDLTRQMQLFEEIEEKDAYLASLLQTRKQSVLALDWDWVPADDSPRAAEVMEATKGALGDLEETMLDLLDAIAKGVSVVTVGWAYDKSLGRQVPVEYRWIHQSGLVYDLEAEQLRLKADSGEPQELAPGEAIVHEYKAKSGSPTRAGLLRALSWLYLFKNYAVKDWAVFLEKYGQPLALGKYDPSASDAERRALMEAVRAIGPEGVGVISSATSIEFKEANRYGTADAYTRFIEMVERGMAVAVTGSPLSSFDGSGGSNAMASTLDKVSLRLTRSDAKSLAASMRKGLVVPFTVANFEDPALAPYYRPVIREPEDLKAAAETIKILADAGARIPAAYVYDKFSIPAPDEGEEVLGQMQRQVASRRLRLASGDRASGFLSGQLYADTLAERAAEAAGRALEGDLERILALAQDAPDYLTLRQRLAGAYQGVSPEELAVLMERALVMAELAGRRAVMEDL